MSTLTPREIVAELDKFVVGQEQAKRMVAVAVRNRWRRQHLPEELRDEVAPKNIIMMGPTGVGKTEIARRLAKLSGAPFIKVEATKFTEVGYVGRDVESMVRDLMEIGITLVREEENTRVRAAAEVAAESRLLDLLLPNSFGGDRNDTREKLRQQFRLGFMDDREVEVEVTEQPAQGVDMFAIPGMEQMGNQVRDMFSKAFPPRRSRRTAVAAVSLPPPSSHCRAVVSGISRCGPDVVPVRPRCNPDAAPVQPWPAPGVVPVQPRPRAGHFVKEGSR